MESRPFLPTSQGQEIKNRASGDQGQPGQDPGKPQVLALSCEGERVAPGSLPSSSSMKMLTQGPSFTAPYKGTILGEVNPAHATNSSARNTSMRTWRGPEVAVSQGACPGCFPSILAGRLPAGRLPIPRVDSEARQGPGGPTGPSGANCAPWGSCSTSSSWLKFCTADVCGKHLESHKKPQPLSRPLACCPCSNLPNTELSPHTQPKWLGHF